MFLKIKSRYILEAEKIMVEVFRITKLYNPKAMIGVTNDDLEYLSNNLAEEYLEHNFDDGLKLLKETIDEFYNMANATEEIDIGDFIKLCYSKEKRQEISRNAQILIDSGSRIDPNVAKENLAKIKKMLAESNAIKKLPYNKDYRVPNDNFDWVDASQNLGCTCYAKGDKCKIHEVHIYANLIT